MAGRFKANRRHLGGGRHHDYRAAIEVDESVDSRDRMIVDGDLALV
jgi:hypothetical protein